MVIYLFLMQGVVMKLVVYSVTDISTFRSAFCRADLCTSQERGNSRPSLCCSLLASTL